MYVIIRLYKAIYLGVTSLGIEDKERKRIIDRNIGIPIAIVSFLFLINLIFNVIKPINSFLLGFFGLLAYVILGVITVFGILITNHIKPKMGWKKILVLCLWLISLMILLQLSTSLNLFSDSYGSYLTNCYNNKLTAGGMLFGLFSYPLYYFTYTVGAFVFSIAFLVIMTAFMIYHIYDHFASKQVVMEENELADENRRSLSDDDDLVVDDSFIGEDEGVELATLDDAKEKAKQKLGLSRSAILKEDKPYHEKEQDSYEEAKNKGISKQDYIFTPYQPKQPTNPARPPRYVHDMEEEGETIQPTAAISKNTKRKLSEQEVRNLNFLRATNGSENVDENEYEAYEEEESQEDTLNQARQNYDYRRQETPQRTNIYNQTATPTLEEDSVKKSNYNTAWKTQQPQPEASRDVYDDQLTQQNYQARLERARAKAREREERKNRQPQQQISSPYSQVQMSQTSDLPQARRARYRQPSKYIKPPIDLLNIIRSSNVEDKDELNEKAEVLESTLASFGIPATVVSTTVGPAFTRFELQMPTGIPVKKVLNYTDDLAMSLESQGAIRIEVPIAGKNAFGVEVPNKEISTVGLRDIIESYNFQGSKSLMTFALGKDITGESKVARLDKMPHLLVAGSTGSGKSVCLNSLIISLLYKASPEQVRFILIDPKRVEFTLYNGLPHLLIPKVITDIDKAIKCLAWLIDEMERRFQLFSDAAVRNVTEYNDLTEVQNGSKAKMPFIVVIVDELGDLMAQNKKEIEEKIIRLVQKSRAAGIHLVLATQRPSVNVITGTIKVNLPSRIAFAVNSFVDSKTILDQAGAEKLLGRGDMLYSPSDAPEPTRIQGSFVDNTEVANIVNFVKENNEAEFDDEIEDQMFNKKNNGFDTTGGDDSEFDPLLKDAVRLTIRSNGISITKIQRAFGVGYPRAGKIVDQMEKMGLISAPDTKNQRTVFITEQEFEERFGEDF